MTRQEAKNLVTMAMDLVIEKEYELLDLKVSERALSHQLARYISICLDSDYLSVDCEYNRQLESTKRLGLPPRTPEEGEIRATTVFPDIVVHRRNSNECNWIVLELKKPEESIDRDRLKLNAFRRELGYKHAAHLVLGMDKSGRLVRTLEWVDDADS